MMNVMRRLLIIVIILIGSPGFADQMKESRAGISRQMSVTISDLLWRYDPVLIEKTLKSSIRNYRLGGVTVFDAGLKEYHAAWPSKEGVRYRKSDSPLEIPGSQSMKSIKRQILHKEKKLGELVLFLKSTGPAIPLNDKERAYLEAHPVIKVSNEVDFAPYDFAIDGEPRGYNIDLINLIAGKIGVDIQFVNGYTWGELVDLFRRDELDLLHAVKITPDRLEYALFSSPYRRLKTYFVTRAGGVEITDIRQLYGKTFAVGKGWAQEEHLEKNHPRVELLRVDNTMEMLEAVSSGKADATAGSDDVLKYIIKKQGMRDLKIGQWFKEMDNGQAYTHHFMAKRTAPELISMLNKALEALSIEELDKLERKWFGGSVVEKFTKPLTENELDFFKRNPRLTVYHHPNLHPYSFFEDGKAMGYWPDLLELMFEGVDVELVHVERTGNNKTYPDLLNRRKADILTSLLVTPKRRERMLFSEPVVTVGYPAILMRTNAEPAKSVSALKDKRIALVEDHPFQRALEIIGIDYQIMTVDSLPEAIEAVSYGLADATLIDKAMAEYWMQKQNITNLAPTGQARLPGMNNLKSAFAVARDRPVVKDILDRLLDRIDPADIRSIKKKWFFPPLRTDKKAMDLTSEERAFIESHPIITASNERMWAPFNFFEDGRPKGFSIDYLNLLAEKAGLKVEYVTGPTWKEFIEIIKRKEIDILLNVAFSNERTAWLEFSDQKYFSVHYGLVVNSTSDNVHEFKDILDKIVAVEDGFWMHSWLRENHPEINIKTYKNTLEALTAVSVNEADAYLGNISIVGYIITRNWLTNIKIRPLGETKLKKSNDLYIGFSKGSAVLKSILDKAMASVTMEEMDRLRRKWFGESQTPSGMEMKISRDKRLGLDPAESLFLDNHGQISYCIDPDWMPIERINDQGEHEGLTNDLIREIGSRMGAAMHLVPTESWSQSLEYIKQGRCHILPAAAETPARLGFLDFTKPYNEFPLVVAVLDEELFVESLSAIQDKTLGVIKGYAHTDLIREKYPALAIEEVDNISNGLKLVRERKIFGFVDTVAVLGYAMRRHGFWDLKIGGKLDIPLKISIAVRRGEPPELLSVLDKTMDSFSGKDKRLLSDKWFSIQIEKVFDYTRLWKVLAGVAVLFIIVLYWNRKLAEKARLHEELLLSTTRLDLALASSQQGWWDWDAVNSFTAASDSYWKMIGYRPDEKRNADMIWEKSIHPDDKPRVMRAVAESVRRESIFDVSYRGCDRYGNPMWFRSMGKAVELSEDRQPLRMIGTIQDITEDKNRELELLRSREEAEKANRAKSEFIANMSHEIRTPLNAVIGFSELFEQTVVTSKQRSYLQSIRMGGKTLLALINDILDLSRIEAGKMSVEEEPVNIRRLFSDIEQIFAFKVRGKALEFRLTIDNGLPEHLMLDEARLRQVLFNLVGNAIKFTHEGEIELSVNARPYEQNKGESHLQIEVRDTGIGIPEDQHEKVFGSFEQQQGQRSRQYGGTGLGLSISKKLVELMGGEIILQSTPGAGSCFTIHLHHVVVTNSHTREASRQMDSTRQVRFEPATILAVDDVESNRRLVKSALRERGLHIVEAMDGSQAVMLCEEIHPDLVLMDIRMPNMDGIDATKRIRENPLLADTPVIALTATLQVENRELFQGLLEKPITPMGLLVELQKHLAHQVGEIVDSQQNPVVEFSKMDRETIMELLTGETVSLWKEAMGGGVFDDAKTFAEALNTLGENHRIKSLGVYAKSVLESVENFDVRRLRELLARFSELIPDEEDNHG